MGNTFNILTCPGQDGLLSESILSCSSSSSSASSFYDILFLFDIDGYLKNPGAAAAADSQSQRPKLDLNSLTESVVGYATLGIPFMRKCGWVINTREMPSEAFVVLLLPMNSRSEFGSINRREANLHKASEL